MSYILMFSLYIRILLLLHSGFIDLLFNFEMIPKLSYLVFLLIFVFLTSFELKCIVFI